VGSPCPDNQFCNGDETCDGAGTCQPGTPVDCSDGVTCTDDSCDEVNDICVHTPNDVNCPDDVLYCNGDEYCHAQNDCSSTGDPCGPGTVCNEATDACDPTPPSARAISKTIEIPIPGSGCFTIRIDNPGPYDIYMSQSIVWTQAVPSDTQTTVLGGSVTVPAGQSTLVYWPCFDVGSGAGPGDYPLDIIWNGTEDITGNPVQFSTDPVVRLVATLPVEGPVGGIVIPVDKLGLVAPWIALIMLVIAIMVSAMIWRKKRRAQW